MIVSEVAKKANVAPHVVRYYARIGLLAPGRNPTNGYRTFDWSDVTRVRFIRSAQCIGLSLGEIRGLLADDGRGAALCCARVQAVLRRRLDETRRRIAELTALEARISQALPRWNGASGCGASDARVVCPLIEGESIRRASRVTRPDTASAA